MCVCVCACGEGGGKCVSAYVQHLVQVPPRLMCVVMAVSCKAAEKFLDQGIDQSSEKNKIGLMIVESKGFSR
jgi:hypothetical protein